MVVVEIKGEQIIYTAIDRVRSTILVYLKRHVFMQRKTIRYMADTGFTGLDRMHTNTLVPKKRSKKHSSDKRR
ncbi:hypothetical protein AGMMS49593_07230 [Endomicrobiia bacterium]|nr:hypothetical protein AGMMS49593_07230 [Endomicrobiia bacterium]